MRMTKRNSRRGARPFLAGLVLAGGLMFGQDVPIQHEVSVLNVEIPVRVFRGGKFVDNLSLKDFQVLDNGQPQTIEAVYLVKKNDIQREEGAKGRKPQIARQFVLFFEMSEYLPEIDAALERFFATVFLPGDNLIVVTPRTTYHLRDTAFAGRTKTAVKDQLRGRLRSDILIGSAEYHSVIRDLRSDLTSSLSFEEKLEAFSVTLSRLESMRQVDEKGLLKFADFLKGLPGQKNVYFFYQKERIPQYDWKQLMQLMTAYHDDMAVTFKLMENFQMFVRETAFNVEAVKKAYADSSVAVHFLYVTKTPAVESDMAGTDPTGLKMVEQSDDIFSAFSEIAASTGGISESSANAAAAFKTAVDASENYYLLYIKPKDYKPDGSFHVLEVLVPGYDRVTHRAGYMAR